MFINNVKVFNHIGDDNYLEPERTFTVRYTIDVINGAGADVNFKAIKGESILNGIQVKKSILTSFKFAVI